MVENVVELLTRYLGAHEVLVAARVELVDGLSQHITGIISDGPEQLERETAGR